MLGFQRTKAMTKHRSHSAAFKRQVAQEFVAGETLHGLSQRHDISRQLIRIWVGKYEAGALDDDVQAGDLLQEYEAKIAALERMVGRQALEIEFLTWIIHRGTIGAREDESPSQEFWWRRRRGEVGLRFRRRVCIGASGPVAHGGNFARRPTRSAKPAW
jgi:transposase-like protein